MLSHPIYESTANHQQFTHNSNTQCVHAAIHAWALLLRRVETKQIIGNVESHVWIAVIVYICTMDVMKSMEQVCMYLVTDS